MYADEVVVHSPNVGALFFGFDIDKFSSEPVVFVTIVVGSLFHLFLPESTALTCPTYSFEWSDRCVDVVAYSIGHALLEEVACEGEDIGLEVAEVGLWIVVVDGVTDGWYGMFCSYEASSHGAGIDDIDGGIGAMVDTAREEVDACRVAFEDDVDGEFDAVARCAIGGVNCGIVMPVFCAPVGVVERTEIHGLLYGDGIAHATTWPIWGNDSDVPQLGKYSYEGKDALGSPAVVVGDKDFHWVFSV